MTVMPAGAEVADKAVSTEDATKGVEVARLEAVLAALMETKVEAMKASSAMTRRSGSAPPSLRRPRLTSSSTASSSQNHHHHHRRRRRHHLHEQQQEHCHQHRHLKHEKKKREGHYHRRHDSAPCGEYLESTHNHHKQRHDKEGRRVSEYLPSPTKKRICSKSPYAIQDAHAGLDLGLELLGIDGEQELALINFERAREVLTDSCEYPGLHRSAYCFSQSAAQLKIHYDEDDYVALNVEDELEEDESLSGPDKGGDPGERYHQRRKKRKRRRRRKVDAEEHEEDLGDPEELPPRARWTIVATACILLTMSLLLVGVTLRMAPIIDDMGDGRRASISKKGKPRRASMSQRRNSIQPNRITSKEPQKLTKNPQEVEQALRHRRIAMIILGTFIFLLIASVLVVVVTLTHSSFLSPATGSPELAKHRAQLRKENEELLNSLNRDSSLPENMTAPP